MPIYSKSRRFSIVPWMAIAIAMGLMALVQINTENTPYQKALRLVGTDPCTAATMLSSIARADDQYSVHAIVRLCELKDVCAFKELISLMDLPDGERVSKESRRRIWQTVYKKACSYSSAPPIPQYDPDGPITLRAQQKTTWNRWLASVDETGPGKLKRSLPSGSITSENK